jgi:hypothetical protein
VQAKKKTSRMKLKNCTYSRWKQNHAEVHKDKIFRALYPYTIFQQISFDEKLIDQVQKFEFEFSNYEAVINKIELQENGRFRTALTLSTQHKTDFAKWKKRTWNEKFQIVYEQDYQFITVFTKNEDISKELLRCFFKGNFNKITKDKSLPISDLLMKALTLQLAESIFGEGDFDKRYDLFLPGVRNLKIPKSFEKGAKNVSSIFPLYSKDRETWVFCSFDEERAHRLAYFNCNQCKNLYVIYCNPTYTRHFRCKHENVHVLSLFEFSYFKTKTLSNQYSEQIRFLQNHLNAIDEYSSNELLAEIENPKKTYYEIYKSELMESLGIMKLTPTSPNEFFLFLSSMNLLNAWINRSKKLNASEKLFRNMYFFKTYLGNTITQIIKSKILLDSLIFIQKDLIMININNFTFSFHNVPVNKVINDYINSDKNVDIKWTGKKLQPISPLIFRLAKQQNKAST